MVRQLSDSQAMAAGVEPSVAANSTGLLPSDALQVHWRQSRQADCSGNSNDDGRSCRVHAKLGKNRFATQIYSRLTNANPELVLAFMRAGQGHRPIKVSYFPRQTRNMPFSCSIQSEPLT